MDTYHVHASSSYGDGEDILVDVDELVAQASDRLTQLQESDGHIRFDLEADATIPSEYIFLNHFLDDLESELEEELAGYIRSLQGDHGGWPLFYEGDFNISASVKAYYALKLVGDDPDAPHMQRARQAILAHGGAETSNVFTRYSLALFGQVPWRAVPVMPVELMLMPRWFPVNVWDFSYWSRTVIAPLLVLAALKPKARNPRQVSVQELFVTAPDKVEQYLHNPTGSRWGDVFLTVDRVLRSVEPLFPKKTRSKAIERAVSFFTERLNGEDGLGAIFPAMANSVMAMDALGYSRDDPNFVTALASVRKLISRNRVGENRFIQPCVSPVWDTALGAHALLESGLDRADERIRKCLDWLEEREVTDVKGDWSVKAPDLEPGGWAFQFKNDHYPDVDDTAVVGMLFHRADPEKHKAVIDRTARWIEGMQSTNGGWGSFDIDNNKDFLNSIPFADHGALLDPPTADVSARCLSFLCQIGHPSDHPTVAKGLAYLKSEQEEDGSWFGRWGTNYIYGTWSVLCALNAAGEDPEQPYIQRAVDWLLATQREDGGWGEDGATYDKSRRGECKESTPSQTAWAVLGLMAAGKADHPAVERGVRYLMTQPREGARWVEPWYTAVGFPRVFYLRYHGYSSYFPIWALARYSTLKRSNHGQVVHGM